MTANEFQRIVNRLSNTSWCRHWLNWNEPNNPRQMAVQCLDNDDHRFHPMPVQELRSKFGFRLHGDTVEERCQFIYVIDRTNDDGTPFHSQL